VEKILSTVKELAKAILLIIEAAEDDDANKKKSAYDILLENVE
jgi:hypothetical protein